MAKFYGIIGYAGESIETEPGIWEDDIVERPHKGDIIRNFGKIQNSGSINDNITISSDISIMADPYAMNHIFAMRYVEYLGEKWKIESVDPQYPRINLKLGGVYNGN